MLRILLGLSLQIDLQSHGIHLPVSLELTGILSILFRSYAVLEYMVEVSWDICKLAVLCIVRVKRVVSAVHMMEVDCKGEKHSTGILGCSHAARDSTHQLLSFTIFMFAITSRLPPLRSLAYFSPSQINTAVQSPFQVFDREAKRLQKDRAAARDGGNRHRTVDYVRDEVANRMIERFIVGACSKGAPI